MPKQSRTIIQQVVLQLLVRRQQINAERHRRISSAKSVERRGMELGEIVSARNTTSISLSVVCDICLYPLTIAVAKNCYLGALT